ncbi:hemopexin [Ambystoma mexicanum]|uniref:hemopexin n=1 Tax=Ambystoma mexicanum TaxID=8296 RepID=UPI0037E838E5
MTALLAAWCLCCSLAFASSYPLIKSKPNDTGSNLLHEGHNNTGMADRCSDRGFNAITLDDKGVMYYFRDQYVWKGYIGPAELINDTWPEVPVPVDAAFRIHHRNKPEVHERMFLFKGNKAWAYYENKLEPGYPKLITDVFPGVPGDLDSALECPAGECKSDSVLFFKGKSVYTYDLSDPSAVKERQWPLVQNCTAAVRWLGKHYCFQDTMFTRFNPVTGEVHPGYPLDTRDYFISCPGRGHGHETRRNATLMSIKNRCSNRSFEAFTSDDSGKTYGFRGGWYFRMDSKRDGWHAWSIGSTWKGLKGTVDAAFNWENKMYFIQGSQVTIFLSDQIYSMVQGYPKPLQDELGMQQVDAAFTCPHSSDLYIIKGNTLSLVDLKNTPRVPGQESSIIHSNVDSAMCNSQGVHIFTGASFHRYKDPNELLQAKELPEARNIAAEFLDCTQ